MADMGKNVCAHSKCTHMQIFTYMYFDSFSSTVLEQYIFVYILERVFIRLFVDFYSFTHPLNGPLISF